MRLFDSNTSKNHSGKYSTLNKKIQLRYGDEYRANFRGSNSFSLHLVGNAPVGAGLALVTIIEGAGKVIFCETIELSRQNKEFSFKINTKQSGMFKILVEVPDKNSGKCLISRILINNSKKITSKIDSKNYTSREYNYEYLKGLSAKIGIIVPYSIHGGAEIYLKNILNELSSSDINFHILYLSKNSKSISGQYNEIYAGSINRLKSQIILNKYSHIIFYNSLSIYNLITSLKEDDLISSKIIEIYHSDFAWSDSVSRIKSRKNVDISIRVSDGLLNDVEGLRRVETIPVGIDMDRFKNSHKKTLRAKYNISNDKPIIGIVARMSPEKNIDYALSIASRMNDFLFLFLGSGPMLSDYRSKNKLNNVIFMGHKDNIEDYHSIFDALLLTSNIEGTPISILEAMASERVVFSTKVGMVPDLITDGENGFFITKDIDKDISIIKNNFNNRLIGKNARKSILKNNIKLTSKAFINVLFDKYEFVPNETPSNIGEFI